MALENAAFVDGLVITNPTGSDSISQGDDHIRLIKKVLKATFPDADAVQSLFAPSGFCASLTAGTLPNGSTDKIPFGTQDFDISSEYDTTLYRFTPTVAGKYYIYHSLSVVSPASVSQYSKMLQTIIFKNGAEFKTLALNMFPYNATNEFGSSVGVIVESNGTDYWEPYAYQNSGVTVNTVSSTTSNFMAIRVA